MIMDKIWDNPTKKWGAIIQRRIERSWGNLLKSGNNYPYHPRYPSDEKIFQAKFLGN